MEQKTTESDGVRMADVASSVRVQQTSRVRALVFPREHGGWGLMLIPLFAGACIGIPQARSASDFLLFLAAALALFWVRTPVEALFGLGVMRVHTPEERRAVLKAIAALLPVVALSGAGLLWKGRNKELLLLAAAGGATFVMQHLLRAQGRGMRLASQIVGAIGLSATAAGALYVVTGRLDSRALAVWFAFWLFACDQIHYVHLRMHTARVVGVAQRLSASSRFLLGQVAMMLAVGAATRLGYLPKMAIVAFIPVFFRGVYWLADRDTKLDLKWIGMTELLQGICFGVVLTATFFVR
jgi:hypothetical protein